MLRKNYMLIVARYNEDTEWVRKYVPNVVIYNKGSKENIDDTLWPYVVDLPNVGREAHTFLWHIVHNYHNLSEVLVFLQCNYSDHLEGTLGDLLTLEKDHSDNLIDSTIWNHNASYYEFRIREWKETNLRPTTMNECYGQWYERLFGKSFPHDYTKVYPGAIFSVKRDVVLRYPKELYESLLEEVSCDVAPEACHFMERTWSKMFAC
jgi:hypothetical protein